jgi:hypothetical protein
MSKGLTRKSLGTLFDLSADVGVTPPTTLTRQRF